MDFTKMLSDSIGFAWNHKKLWVLGFLASLVSGSSFYTGNLGSPSNGNSSRGDFETSSFFETYTALVLLCVALILVFIISLIFWYLGRVGTAGLIHASRKNYLDNEYIGLKASWKFGRQKALKLMGLDFLFFVIMLPLIILFVFFPFLICCLFFAIIPLAFLFALWTYAAQRFVVLEDKGVIDSLSLAWRFTANNLSKYAEGGLWSVLVGIVIFFFQAMLIVPVVLLGIVVATALLVNSLLGIFAIISYVILVYLFLGVIESGISVFMHDYWTRVFLEIKKNWKEK